MSDDRLGALSEAFRAFAETSSDYGAAIEAVARTLVGLIADAVVVFMTAEDGTWTEPNAACGRDAAATELLRDALARMVGERGGYATRVVRTGEDVLIPHIDPHELAKTAAAPFADALHQLSVHSFLCVPIVARGKRFGALTLLRYGAASAAFAPADRTFARSLGEHAGLALANARLFESLQRELAETKRLEAALAHAQKMEALGRLAGGVAHDFNNLLTVILSYCALLGKRLPAGGRDAHDVQQIERAGQRAAELTRQLLAFGRRQVLAPTALDLGDAVRGMAGLLRQLVGEDLELAIDGGARGSVLADAGQIEQVVMNLAANARDAMADVAGGVLSLHVEPVQLDLAGAAALGVTAGAYQRLSVRDTGTGIDAATRAHLFEPFYTTKSQGKGTGLGLSMVKGIVEQSGGAIDVISAPGHGSTFRVYLPATAMEPTRPRSPTGGIPVGGRERILLVEDEEPVRAIVRGVLEGAGYAVVEARDAEHALELAGERVDLLLTDVVMPHTSGPQLAAAFRAQQPATRVLFMSGYTADKLGEDGVLDPDVELIQKPLTPDALLRRVRALLG